MSNIYLYNKTTKTLLDELQNESNAIIDRNTSEPSQTVYNLETTSSFELNNTFEISNDENNILTQHSDGVISKINFEYTEPILTLGDFDIGISFVSPNTMSIRCQKINNFAHINLIINNINFTDTFNTLNFTIVVSNIRDNIFESYNDAGGICSSKSGVGSGRIEALTGTTKLLIYFNSVNVLNSAVSISCMIKI